MLIIAIKTDTPIYMYIYIYIVEKTERNEKYILYSKLKTNTANVS